MNKNREDRTLRHGTAQTLKHSTVTSYYEIILLTMEHMVIISFVSNKQTIITKISRLKKQCVYVELCGVTS